MNEATAQNQTGSPTPPPPPQEVKVRTMASDLASMAASGGGLPQFQNVKIAKRETKKASSGGNLLVLIVVILALLVLGAVAYFGYQALQKNTATQTQSAGT